MNYWYNWLHYSCVIDIRFWNKSSPCNPLPFSTIHHAVWQCRVCQLKLGLIVTGGRYHYSLLLRDNYVQSDCIQFVLISHHINLYAYCYFLLLLFNYTQLYYLNIIVILCVFHIILLHTSSSLYSYAIIRQTIDSIRMIEYPIVTYPRE